MTNLSSTGVIVVGAGIAGLACARVLADAGLAVTVLDRGHRVGGRMASKTVGGRLVDTGASYFTAGDPDFTALAEDWRDRGLAREWTDTFTVLGDGPAEAKTGPMRWGAPRGLRSLMEDLATGLSVERAEVHTVAEGRSLAVDGRPAQAVVLAMPDPQARRLLAADSPTRTVVDRDYAPTLALVASWPKRIWAADFHGAFVSGDDAVAWIADDGHRRGDGAAVLVAHSTVELAPQHLDRPEQATGPMLDNVLRLLSVSTPPASTLMHRWSYAQPANPRGQDHYLGENGVGVCGDGWAAKPRVEGAWLSGRALAHSLVDRMS